MADNTHAGNGSTPRATFEFLASADPLSLDMAGAEARLRAQGVLRSWLDGDEAVLLARIEHLRNQGAGDDPEDVLRKTQRTSGAEARRKTRRARTAAKTPDLTEALGKGETTAAHVDVVANAASQLTGEQRDQLFDLANAGVNDAKRQTPEAYVRTVAKLVDKIRRDEGLERHEGQCRDTKLRRWVNPKTGMFVVNGELEPVLGQKVFSAIDAEVERMWRQSLPTNVAETTTMPDLTRKNEHLAAQALGSLVTAGHAGECGSVPEVLVLIDDKTLESGVHPDSVSETAIGAYLPPDTIRRLCCDAHITPVIRRQDGTVLNVGRKTRTANRSQRRALRAMYRTCALDGCTKPFDWCQMHHVQPWSDFGLTDLDNLVPLCHTHHHLVHEGKWALKLLPDRSLKLYRPDGRHFSTTGPPKLRDVDPPDG